MGKPLKSVTHGPCDARPMLTFSVTGHRYPMTGTKLYYLVTEARVCTTCGQWNSRELKPTP